MWFDTCRWWRCVVSENHLRDQEARPWRQDHRRGGGWRGEGWERAGVERTNHCSSSSSVVPRRLRPHKDWILCQSACTLRPSPVALLFSTRDAVSPSFRLRRSAWHLQTSSWRCPFTLETSPWTRHVGLPKRTRPRPLPRPKTPRRLPLPPAPCLPPPSPPRPPVLRPDTTQRSPGGRIPTGPVRHKLSSTTDPREDLQPLTDCPTSASRSWSTPSAMPPACPSSKTGSPTALHPVHLRTALAAPRRLLPQRGPAAARYIHRVSPVEMPNCVTELKF